MNFDKELDTRGLNCPLPILRTKKALTDLASGQVLKVVATDPGAVKDFQTFSRQTGHELVSHAEANKEIDTRGLNCPLPILKAKKALADMASGDVLKVVATDPGSVRDFQAFARQTGNELLEQSSGDGEFVHFLKRR